MLPTKLRLNPSKINLVRKTGRKVIGDNFDAWFVISDSSAFWVWIPKNTISQAHDRNRTRRLVHESLQTLVHQFKFSTEAVIKITSMPIDSSLSKITTDLKKTFIKAGILDQ